MKIINKTNNDKIEKALNIALEFLYNKLNLILDEDFFTHTKDTVKEVHDNIQKGVNSNTEIVINSWYPWNRWTRAIAYASNNQIYINMRKVDSRYIHNYVNTIVHECCHLDIFGGYGHGSNNPIGKEHSVNYKVGTIAEDWAKRIRERAFS